MMEPFFNRTLRLQKGTFLESTRFSLYLDASGRPESTALSLSGLHLGTYLYKLRNPGTQIGPRAAISTWSVSSSPNYTYLSTC